MADDERDIDLEIVSNSWRSISEANAFDTMLEAWDRKFNAKDAKPRIPLIDGILKRQLASIEQILADRRDIRIEDPVEAALAETPAPAMILSPHGLVVALNDGASAHFRVQQGLSAGTDWLSEESLSDFRAVRGSKLGGGNIDYAIVRTVDTNGDPALAEVYQLATDNYVQPYTVIRSLELEWLPDVQETLKKVLGLTQAETEICQLLFANRDIAAVAEQRSASIETVRTQIKRILNKADVHSKAELIRLLAMLCARAGFKKEQTDLTWSDPFGRECLFTRRDGRKLAHSWVGAEDGRPILFLAGQTTFYFLPEKTRKQLADAGVKLICPSLPGYGHSDPCADKSQLVDGCDALEEFCEEQKFGPIPAFASHGDQYYLAYLANLRPDLISRMLCLGLPWSILPDKLKSLSLNHRTALKLAKDAPFAFDLIFKLGFRMIQQWGPDFVVTHWFANTAIDRATMVDPEIQPLLRSAVRHLVAQDSIARRPGAYKYEQEFVAKSPMADWLEQLVMPLHWLVPEGVGSIDARDVAQICDINPHLSIELVEDAGELLVYQKPELFADRLIALAAQ